MSRAWIWYLVGFATLLNAPLRCDYFHGNNSRNAALLCDYFTGILGCNPPNNLTLPAIFLVNILIIFLILLTYKRSHLARFEINFRRTLLPLLIQGSVQVSLFYYVILMNQQSAISNFFLERMPFIFYQIIFAFSFDYLLTIWRGKIYNPKFYVIPMVFSFNLFIWFTFDFSILQLAVIIFAILTKTFIVRRGPDGSHVHIFNPSFVGLAPVSLLIMAFGLTGTTPNIMSVEFTTFWYNTPHLDIFVFCVGCITLWMPNSYLIPIGAYSTIMFLDYLSQSVFGDILFFGTAAGGNMIALMLGITDPKTAPNSSYGKLMYGISYGLSLTFFYFALAIFNPPNVYFSKIFPVPILNLFSSKFDSWFLFPFNSIAYFAPRAISILLFTIIFALTYSTLLASTNNTFTLASVFADHVREAFGYAPFHNNGV